MARKSKRPKVTKENIGHRQAQEVEITIDDPQFVPCGAARAREVSATLNSKGNPIALLYAKGHIDWAQKMAADKFLEYWGVINRGANIGIDYSRTKVDGGNYNAGMMTSVLDAGKEIVFVQQKLGVVGYELVCKVVGEGVPISHLFQKRQAREAKTFQLYECLETLAIFWGFKSIDYVKAQNMAGNEKKRSDGKLHPFEC